MGDPVILWGEGLPVEEIAVWADTIPYELLCGISQRVAVTLELRAQPCALIMSGGRRADGAERRAHCPPARKGAPG